MSSGTDKPAASRNVSAKSSRDEAALVVPGLMTPGRKQRGSQRFLEDPAACRTSRLAEIKPWSDVDDDGVIREPFASRN
jgi:hypothetical protein